MQCCVAVLFRDGDELSIICAGSEQRVSLYRRWNAFFSRENSQ